MSYSDPFLKLLEWEKSFDFKHPSRTHTHTHTHTYTHTLNRKKNISYLIWNNSCHSILPALILLRTHFISASPSSIEHIYKLSFLSTMSFPGGASGKEPACQCRRCNRRRFDPWVGKISWNRKWQPNPAFLPAESHGPRSLAGYTIHGIAKSRHDWSDLAHGLFKHPTSQFHFMLKTNLFVLIFFQDPLSKGS